ncbi:MAG: sodium:proton antiporter [Armatimonadota bacterium]|nr:sodium:proton antiporter [Armatimonadota bacterium]
MTLAPGLPLDAAVGLLLLAIAVAAITKRLDVPYTVALVVVGLILGSFSAHNSLNLTENTVLLLFVPALMFQAAIEIPWTGLRRNLWHILGLAVGGVILNAFLVAAAVHRVTSLSFTAALLFGSIVASTDPTAVVALFRDLKINKRLTLLIESESLFNDGIAATLFLTVLASATGSSMTLERGAILFFQQCLGGAAIGGLLGWLMSFVTGHIDDLLIENALTLVLAYGSYLVADHVHVSGLTSVLVAGLVVGNHGLPNRVHPEIRLSIQKFWEFAAFLANSLLFLLMGIKAVSLMKLFQWPQDFLLTLIILVCRAVVVFLFLALSRRKNGRIPIRWQVVLSWGGLRGAVSVALALSLPHDLPYAPALLGAVYATTLLTLLIQGSTIKPLVRWLKIPMREE